MLLTSIVVKFILIETFANFKSMICVKLRFFTHIISWIVRIRAVKLISVLLLNLFTLFILGLFHHTLVVIIIILAKQLDPLLLLLLPSLRIGRIHVDVFIWVIFGIVTRLLLSWCVDPWWGSWRCHHWAWPHVINLIHLSLDFLNALLGEITHLELTVGPFRKNRYV